jgi:hypothetical protein
MDDIALFVIGTMQIFNLLVYRWAARVYLLQPRWNYPEMFRGSLAQLIFGLGPLVLFVVFVITAFFVTESPWWFLGISIVGWIAATPRL